MASVHYKSWKMLWDTKLVRWRHWSYSGFHSAVNRKTFRQFASMLPVRLHVQVKVFFISAYQHWQECRWQGFSVKKWCQLSFAFKHFANGTQYLSIPIKRTLLEGRGVRETIVSARWVRTLSFIITEHQIQEIFTKNTNQSIGP